MPSLHPNEIQLIIVIGYNLKLMEYSFLTPKIKKKLKKKFCQLLITFLMYQISVSKIVDTQKSDCI